MLTGPKLARLNELAAQRRSDAQNRKLAELVAAFQAMGRLRQADLAALKDDDALTESVSALSRRTIRKMYLAQQNTKVPVEG